MKKFAILFITLLIGFLCPEMQAQNKPTDTDGDGYLNISTLTELRWLTEKPQSWSWDFELDNDIDAYETENWNDGKGWSPIGNISVQFTGHFDGHGYEIVGLYVNRPDQYYCGLFGYTAGAEIRSLGVINCDIIGKNYVGSLAGYNNSTRFQAVYSSGNAVGKDYVGGLVGQNVGHSNVSNSYSTGSVVGIRYVGGLVGDNSASVDNSFWDIQTSGQTSSVGGTGKTTAEMKTQSTFTGAGWDFNTIWDIDGATNDGYPFLSTNIGTVKVEDNLFSTDKGIIIFPNPAENEAVLGINFAISGDITVEIYDLQGERVAEVYSGKACEQITIDTSKLPSGTYQVLVKTNDEVNSVRFIVVR